MRAVHRIGVLSLYTRLMLHMCSGLAVWQGSVVQLTCTPHVLVGRRWWCSNTAKALALHGLCRQRRIDVGFWELPTRHVHTPCAVVSIALCILVGLLQTQQVCFTNPARTYGYAVPMIVCSTADRFGTPYPECMLLAN